MRRKRIYFEALRHFLNHNFSEIPCMIIKKCMNFQTNNSLYIPLWISNFIINSSKKKIESHSQLHLECSCHAILPYGTLRWSFGKPSMRRGLLFPLSLPPSSSLCKLIPFSGRRRDNRKHEITRCEGQGSHRSGVYFSDQEKSGSEYFLLIYFQISSRFKVSESISCWEFALRQVQMFHFSIKAIKLIFPFNINIYILCIRQFASRMKLLVWNSNQ